MPRRERYVVRRMRRFSQADSERRRGQPRTDEERRQRHQELYGTDELPPRGTGLLGRLLGRR